MKLQENQIYKDKCTDFLINQIIIHLINKTNNNKKWTSNSICNHLNIKVVTWYSYPTITCLRSLGPSNMYCNNSEIVTITSQKLMHKTTQNLLW